MAELKALADDGLAIAVDDFGTGLAGFGYLRHLPVSVLKIDKSFIDGVGSEPTNTAISTGIIALGHSVGMQLVAEGIETNLQRITLQSLACDRGQGWLWHPALRAAAIGDLLEQPAAQPAARVAAGAPPCARGAGVHQAPDPDPSALLGPPRTGC